MSDAGLRAMATPFVTFRSFFQSGHRLASLRHCASVAQFCTMLLLALAGLALLLAALWPGDGSLFRFLYDSKRLAMWALGAGLFAVIGKRSLATVFAVIVAISLIGVCTVGRYVHMVRNWSDVYLHTFAGIEPGQYRWWIGSQRWIDVGDCDRVWFATYSSFGGGAYDFWRIEMGRRRLKAFVDRNSEIVWDPHDPRRIKSIRRIPCDALPTGWRAWDGSNGVDWWAPPQDDDECDCYEWKDRSGNTSPWMLVDNKRGTVWIR